MTAWLLDVNVLVARFWDQHVFHQKVRAWMRRHERDGWATCPITQAGLVRTLSNPAFAQDAPRPSECIHWLAETLRENPNHQFWTDDLPLSIACKETGLRLGGFKQVTDAYLLGLAFHKGARMVTLDRRMLAFAPEQSPLRKALRVLV